MSAVNVELPFADSRVDRVSVRTAPSLLGVLLRSGGVLLVVMDMIVIFAAFALAFWARFQYGGDHSEFIDESQFARFALLVAAVAVGIFFLHGFADPAERRSWPRRLELIVSATSTSLVLVLTLSFFAGDPPLSRIWLASAWALSIAGLVAWRSTAPRIHQAIRDRVVHGPRVLVVGATTSGIELARALTPRQQLVGFVDNGLDDGVALGGPLLGPITELASLVQAHGVDEVVVALPPSRREQISRVIARGFNRAVRITFMPDVDDEQPRGLGMADLLPNKFEVGRLGTRAYIAFAPKADVTWEKRLNDVVLGSMIALMLTPVFAVIAIAIKLDSPGPVFYGQERLGLHGRRFRMRKFRSMCVDADAELATLRERNEAVGAMFKIKDDPRVTRVGRILRRFSLDELPQIINVLNGDMSLVGPRPPLPAEIADYEDWQLGRLRALPGMTGLWQVSGRSEVPFNDMVRLDLHYIRNWSMGLDLEIILRTLPAVLSRRGAY
jgi:exopolysaccharide biosynthesis polyprenyl glycosylphosphotransferase